MTYVKNLFEDYKRFINKKFIVCDTRNITISFLYSVVGKVYLDIK